MGAAEWTGYSSPAMTSSYTPFQPSAYDQSSVLPTVLPNEGLSYNPSDYHCGASAQNAAASYGGSQYGPLTPWTNEMDQYNYSYNSYQYPCQPTPQAQYPPSAAPPPPAQATMLIYPQLYSSTVNQNQIHLHLHGSEKIEQYLGATPVAIQADGSPFTISAVTGASGNASQQRSNSLDIPSNNILVQSEENKHQQPVDPDADICEQGVWRPY